MLTLKACSSGWTPAHDGYNGLANFPVSQPGVREHFCNYCPTRILTVYHADVRPSRALTMERLADLRSSDVSPGSGQTSQYKGVWGLIHSCQLDASSMTAMGCSQQLRASCPLGNRAIQP